MRRATAAALLGALLCLPANAARAAAGDELLTADAAFRLLAARRQGDTVVVSWLIAPGYYLYRDRLHFRVTLPAGARLAAPLLPQAQTVPEPGQGPAAVYRYTLQVVLRWQAASPPPLQLAVSYQGCADAGFCYPPQTRLLDVGSARS